jgi:hypothetical protein
MTATRDSINPRCDNGINQYLRGSVAKGSVSNALYPGEGRVCVGRTPSIGVDSLQ